MFSRRVGFSQFVSDPQNKIMAADAGIPNSVMYLDELKLDSTGTIVVMLCRIWDVNASTNGRYLGTEFLVSDAKVCIHLPV